MEETNMENHKKTNPGFYARKAETIKAVDDAVEALRTGSLERANVHLLILESTKNGVSEKVVRQRMIAHRLLDKNVIHETDPNGVETLRYDHRETDHDESKK